MTYFDINDFNDNKLTEYIKKLAPLDTLLHLDTKTWKRVIIPDEFSDATKKQKDSLKTVLEKYSDNKQCLFIICLNVDESKSLKTVISPAILSRVYQISFNTKKTDMPELTERVKDKFPMLSIDDIKNKMPDIRQIQMLANMAYG